MVLLLLISREEKRIHSIGLINVRPKKTGTIYGRLKQQFEEREIECLRVLLIVGEERERERERGSGKEATHLSLSLCILKRRMDLMNASKE